MMDEYYGYSYDEGSDRDYRTDNRGSKSYYNDGDHEIRMKVNAYGDVVLDYIG